MKVLTDCLVFCTILTLVTSSPGFEFSRKLPPTGYCARLECSANIIQTGNQVSFIYKLAIYDVTQTNTSKVKLASVSVLDPGIFVDPTKASAIHALGNGTKSYGILTLDLLDKTDCHGVSFLCELDFVNESEQTDVLKKFVFPDNSDNGQTTEILSMLNQIKSLIVAESVKIDAELAALRNDTAFLKTEVSILRNQSAVIQKTLDLLVQHMEVTPATNTQCLRGSPASSSRVPFMLWGRIPAICDTETDGGGWVIIQRRTKGDVDFYRPWADYKNGFGNTSTDFWIGNDVIHNLTVQGYTTVWIDLVFYNNTHNYARYSNFHVGDEASLYSLTVSNYTGTAGDSLFYHNGAKFSTWDREYDQNHNCTMYYRGGWWYQTCYFANLNGLFNTTDDRGIQWKDNYLTYAPVSSTEIKLRHV